MTTTEGDTRFATSAAVKTACWLILAGWAADVLVGARVGLWAKHTRALDARRNTGLAILKW
jgi:hypothetical protein